MIIHREEGALPIPSKGIFAFSGVAIIILYRVTTCAFCGLGWTHRRADTAAICEQPWVTNYMGSGLELYTWGL